MTVSFADQLQEAVSEEAIHEKFQFKTSDLSEIMNLIGQVDRLHYSATKDADTKVRTLLSKMCRLLAKVDLGEEVEDLIEAKTDVERENEHLVRAQKAVEGLVKDATKRANITWLASSSAHRAYSGGERWGGGGNTTTYPKKHYAKIEKTLGVVNAKELSFFDAVYKAWMRWLTQVKTLE